MQIDFQKVIAFLKSKGITREDVINLIDQYMEDGQIDAAEAADLKRQVKAIHADLIATIVASLASGTALALEVCRILGVI